MPPRKALRLAFVGARLPFPQLETVIQTTFAAPNDGVLVAIWTVAQLVDDDFSVLLAQQIQLNLLHKQPALLHHNADIPLKRRTGQLELKGNLLPVARVGKGRAFQRGHGYLLCLDASVKPLQVHVETVVSRDGLDLSAQAINARIVQKRLIRLPKLQPARRTHLQRVVLVEIVAFAALQPVGDASALVQILELRVREDIGGSVEMEEHILWQHLFAVHQMNLKRLLGGCVVVRTREFRKRDDIHSQCCQTRLMATAQRGCIHASQAQRDENLLLAERTVLQQGNVGVRLLVKATTDVDVDRHIPFYASTVWSQLSKRHAKRHLPFIISDHRRGGRSGVPVALAEAQILNGPEGIHNELHKIFPLTGRVNINLDAVILIDVAVMQCGNCRQALLWLLAGHLEHQRFTIMAHLRLGFVFRLRAWLCVKLVKSRWRDRLSKQHCRQ